MTKTGLSLKLDPVDRDHAEDRAKRLGAILKWIARKLNGYIFLSRGLSFKSKLPGFNCLECSEDAFSNNLCHF